MQVIISNSLSTTGITLAKLEKELALYKKENILLQEKVLHISSLTHIASVASELGFVQEKSQVYLSTPLPLAVKP